MDSLKFGLTISSLSYHPDYSRLSLHNLMPELPPYMTHVGDDKPVVFYVKEGKPEVAILPVYVMKDNGNHLVSPATILKTSPPQPKELVRLHTASTETTTTRSSSRKKNRQHLRYLNHHPI
ncbi:hypothetical protein DINM_002806 [Dirofilaria immitis]|nr:hypothetical protein [Dirofilaria immitis]